MRCSSPFARPGVLSAREGQARRQGGAAHPGGNYGGAVSYEPNSFGRPVEDLRFKEPPLAPEKRSASRRPSGSSSTPDSGKPLLTHKFKLRHPKAGS